VSTRFSQPTNFSTNVCAKLCVFNIIVAVMKLKTKVGSISSARLNKDCFQPSFGDFYRVYGFGRTSDGGSISDVLKSLKQDYVPIGSTRAYILAEDSSSNGVCQGDSGGPFVNSQDVIFGVVSFTIGSCANGRFCAKNFFQLKAAYWRSPNFLHPSLSVLRYS